MQFQVAIGMACRDRCVAFVSTFACFLTRAFDNFRMGVISQTNINVVGSRKYIYNLDTIFKAWKP